MEVENTCAKVVLPRAISVDDAVGIIYLCINS